MHVLGLLYLYQCNCNQSPKDWSGAVFQNIVYMKYTQQVWLSQTLGELTVVAVLFKTMVPSLVRVRGSYELENNVKSV